MSHVLLFVVRRLPFIRNDVGSNNMHVGMQVFPGTDWMYDMKEEDKPQNAAQGSSMVGTVICVEAMMGTAS